MGDEWHDYKPPSRVWLQNTKMSNKQLQRALRQMSFCISTCFEGIGANETLKLADEMIGKGAMLDNRSLGRVLHLRDFMLQKLWHKKRIVKMVRRWDRRMIKALRDDAA